MIKLYRQKLIKQNFASINPVFYLKAFKGNIKSSSPLIIGLVEKNYTLILNNFFFQINKNS